MFRHLFRKEFQENILDRRFLFAFLLCLALFPVSFQLMVGAYRYFAGARDWALYFRSQNTFAAKISASIAAAPSPINVFAYGSASNLYRPVTIGRRSEVWVSERIIAQGGTREQNNLVLAYLYQPDYLSVAKTILSILALLFASTAISWEKENGTLRQILANSVGRGTILMSKWAGCFVSIALLAIAFFSAGLFQALLSGIRPDSEFWARSALILLATLLYVAVFVNIGLIISALTRSTELSTLVAMLVWLILVIVVPAAAVAAAELIYPVPTLQQMQMTRIGLESQIRGGMVPVTGDKSLELSREQAQALNRRIRERLDALDQYYVNRIFMQVKIAKYLAGVSPVLSFSDCVTGLARTGIEDERNFYLQLKSYARAIAEYDKPQDELDSLKEPEKLPSFEYMPHPLGRSLMHVADDIALLLLYLGITAFMALARFTRYDVR